MARENNLRGRTTQYMRKVYKHRIEQGEVLLCGICDTPCVAGKTKKKSDLISRGGLGSVTVDHIIPLSQGGEDRVGNMQPAHVKCNRDKGDETQMKIIGQLLGQTVFINTNDKETLRKAREFMLEHALPKEPTKEDILLPRLIEIVNPREKPTPDRLRKLRNRLKEYTEDEIVAAAVAFSKSDWHRENKQMFIDNLLAPSKFGRWYALSQEPERKKFA